MDFDLICGKCSSPFARRHGGPPPRYCYECKPSRLHPVYACRRCSCEVMKGRWVCDACKVEAERRNALKKAIARRGGKIEPNYRRRPDGTPRKHRPPEARRVEAERRAQRAGREYLSREERAALRLIRTQERAADLRREREARAAALVEAKPWNRPGIGSAEKYALRYRLDPEFNLRERLRSQIRDRRKVKRFEEGLRHALNGRRSAKALFQALGYTSAALRIHFERQFTAGMTWSEFSAGRIHIGHVVPLCTFDLSVTAEVHAAWAITNLRPEWATDNIRRGSRREELL